VQLPLSGETSVGRSAIESWFGGLIKNREPNPNKLVEVKVVSDKAIVYTGARSGVFHGDKGPIQMSGHYSDAVVREDNGWKIVLDTINTTPQN
jgi:hypothetical protein